MSNSGDSQGTTTPPAATTTAPVDKTYASVVARPPGITNIELRTVVLSIDARFAVDGEVALVGLGIADADGNIGYVVLPGATRSVSIANNIPILAFDTEGRSLVPPESGRFWQLARPIQPGATYEVDVVLSADGETFPPARSPGTAWGRAVIPGRPIPARPEVAVSSNTASLTPLEIIDAQGRGQLVWERVPSRVPQGAWQARFRPEEPLPPPPPPPPVNDQLRHLAENAQEGLHQMQNRRANEAFWLDIERQLFPPPPPPAPPVPGPSLPPNPAWLERSRLGVNTPDPAAALTAPPPPPPPPQPPQPITPLYVGGTVLGPATFAERRPFDQDTTEEPPATEHESSLKLWARRHFRLKDDPEDQRVHW